MKNLQLLAFAPAIIFIFYFGLSSCHKPDDDAPAPSAQFSAVINGEAFKPNIITASAQMDNMITVGGWMPKAADTFQLLLSFGDTVTVNSKLTFRNDEAILYYTTTKGAPTYSSWAWYAHGTVTFTTVDKTNKKIAGNFNGVLYRHAANLDSLVVTDGQFNTTYK